jgi:hypothetical protein
VRLRSISWEKLTLKPNDLPKGVNSITNDDLGNIGVDEKGDLWWRNKRVEARHPLELSRWQTLGVAVVTFATCSMAIFDALRFFAGR